MNPTAHSIQPEELMAFLDGELESGRKAEVSVHLNGCQECREIVKQLENTSQQLQRWSLEDRSATITPILTNALEKAEGVRREKPRKKYWSNLFGTHWRSFAWAGGLAALAVVLYVGNSEFPLRTRMYRREVGTAPVQGKQFDRLEQFAKLNAPPPVQFPAVEKKAGSAPILLPGSGPMIIRTAQLSLVTKDFEKVRDSVQSILLRHRGYLADLKTGGKAGNGQSLTGTLRVPADQLDSTMSDLKTLGRVDSETQTGEDVTSQYVDIEARLTNARHTEQRLTDLLANRTGKLSDVLEVEQEISRVRGEIEQMEAERKTMANQVSFATVNLTVSEDYQAQLQVVPPSTFTRLRNAAVEGYQRVVEGGLDLALFLLSTGPTLLVWALILFLPARFAWRRVRQMSA